MGLGISIEGALDQLLRENLIAKRTDDLYAEAARIRNKKLLENNGPSVA